MDKILSHKWDTRLEIFKAIFTKKKQKQIQMKTNKQANKQTKNKLLLGY